MIVYILECADKSFYTGVTSDIQKRLRQHNGLERGGAKYTRSHRPVRLVYLEKFQTRKEACKREFEIKSLTHEQKKELSNKISKEEIFSII